MYIPYNYLGLFLHYFRLKIFIILQIYNIILRLNKVNFFKRKIWVKTRSRQTKKTGYLGSFHVSFLQTVEVTLKTVEAPMHVYEKSIITIELSKVVIILYLKSKSDRNIMYVCFFFSHFVSHDFRFVISS